MTIQENNYQEIANAIKERVNCVDLANELGLITHETEDSFRGYSLQGGNNDTCFMIYKNNPNFFIDWKDESEGNKQFIGGDVIDLCAAAIYNGNKSLAFTELIKKAGLTAQTKVNTSGFMKKQNELPQNVIFWCNELHKNSDILNYIKTRLGSKAENTIDRLKLGYSPKQDRIIIPYLKNNRPVYYCTRRSPNFVEPDKNSANYNEIMRNNPKYRKARVKYYGSQICWGLDTVTRKTPLIVAEGAFDAITFEQEGYAVLSPITGNFSKEQTQEFISIARRVANSGRDIILIFDSDEAGESFTRKNARILFNNQIPFKTASIPEGFKDVSEYYEKYEEVEGILETIEDGMLYLAKSFEDNQLGFEKFIRKASRHISTPNLSLLFSQLKKHKIFEVEWLKSLEAEIKKIPAEPIICREIREDHQLVYIDGSGFYEFEGDIWKLKTDKDIRGYIDKAMGKFSNGRKSSSILDLISDKCNSHIEFNKKPVMTFTNGTLELDTGKLRKPRANDYSTIKANYPYNPEATCDKWNSYLKDVTDSDLSKMELLQEIAGYCLFTENSIHKCAYLIGEGRNGKSVYLKVLSELFGNNNISKIGISQFEKEFYRIYLRDSIINISSEEKIQVGESEDVFKNLTAGDPITGCFKFKNLVDFTSRAKLVVSGNYLPKFHHSCFGLEERFIFVGFNEKFVDYQPKSRHEHKAKHNIVNELLEELSGIFNWTYKGYQKLKETGRFTVNEENQEILQEFKESNDPLVAFISEYEFGSATEIHNSEAYWDYSGWCALSGHKPMSETAFKRRFKSAFIKEYPDWEAYRTGSIRGVRKSRH